MKRGIVVGSSKKKRHREAGDAKGWRRKGTTLCSPTGLGREKATQPFSVTVGRTELWTARAHREDSRKITAKSLHFQEKRRNKNITRGAKGTLKGLNGNHGGGGRMIEPLRWKKSDAARWGGTFLPGGKPTEKVSFS